MKRIEIVVAPDGGTKLQTTGFSGAECRAASQFLVTALGMREHETFTSEWHQSVASGLAHIVEASARD